MTTISPEAAPVISSRFNFAFSSNGRYGVCLRTVDEDLALEHWTLAPEEACSQTISGIVVDRGTHALPLDDGRILLLQTDVKGISERCKLTLLRPQDGSWWRQQLGAISAQLGGYLLPSPSPADLGFVVTCDELEQSTIWRLLTSPPRISQIMRVPGFLSGGVWLDSDQDILATNQTCKSSRCNGILICLSQQSWRRIWSVSETSDDRIVHYSLRSKLLVVTTNAGGEERLGWGRLGKGTVIVRFPETLYRPGYVRKALALDDRGKRLLVHEVAGSISRLLVYTPSDDRLEPLAGPPGIIWPPASWAGDVIRLRFSAPSQPPTLATVQLGTEFRWSFSRSFRRDHALESHPVWAEAELIELQGPGGPIEAIVYGGPSWRQCQHLVVALHGGPLASWRFEFDPLFQCLAAAGIAVVAPNYRGSTGYGDEHLRAILGNWGGPDLDDVLALRQSLEEERRRLQLPRPVVLGVSYGAFLALLAACNAPELWSACVALAPFLSGPSLHKSAGVAVRSRIEQLGGLKQTGDASGTRDALQACKSLSVPLLLIHGTRDEIIPVEQSRMLRRHLVELGRMEGFDFEYLEVDSDHTGVVLAWPKILRQRVVHFCLAQPGMEPQTISTREPLTVERR
jgi:pimeloyl-ACP methyl ester carboxylesterase